MVQQLLTLSEHSQSFIKHQRLLGRGSGSGFSLSVRGSQPVVDHSLAIVELAPQRGSEQLTSLGLGCLWVVAELF